jgi:2-methylisocitrate lyase-like PEP mutase family enzyme
VSADLENCFADDPEGVATTVRLAIEAGLAGGSVEDFTGDRSNAIYPAGLAADRVAAAAEAAHGGSTHYVLTARAEGLLHGVGDLDDIIARLVSYQEAGADVLFAPGLVDLGQIREVLAAVDRPLNVLALRGAATIAELADAGVRRISVGGAFAWVALAGVIDAARELLDQGTTSYVDKVMAARQAAVAAFTA